MPLKDEITGIIKNHTEYYQPRGEMGSIFIIEDKDPFFWRINPDWANEVATQILDLIRERLPKEKLHTHDSIPNYIDEVDAGCIVCIRNQALNEVKNVLK